MTIEIKGIQRWAARVVLRDTYDEMEQARQALVELAQWNPVGLRTMMQQGLAEQDSRYINLLARLAQYQSGIMAYEPTETDRLASVSEARTLQDTDPPTQRAINIWTDFGFGMRVLIKCRDPAADEVFQEFWTAHRNRPMLADRVLHEHSQQVLTDGEMYWPFFIASDGRSTVRTVPTEEISEIITLPDDDITPLYYHRVYAPAVTTTTVVRTLGTSSENLYYEDWLVHDSDVLKQVELPDGTKMAGDLRDNTIVVMLHISHNRRSLRTLRGWPITKTAGAWSRAYHEFLQNRVAVARAVAMFVDKLTAKGPSGPIEAIRQTFDRRMSGIQDLISRREPVGATWIQNEQVDRQRMPLTTGGSDARTDGMTLLSQAATGMDIPPNLLGRPDMMQNRSVADVSYRPFIEAMERYQMFWSSVWRDVVDLVLTYYTKVTDEEFETHECDVTLDVPISYQLDDIVKAMSVLEQAVLLGASVDGVKAATEHLLAMTLNFVGVGDTDSILNPEGGDDAPPTTRSEELERRFVMETDADYAAALQHLWMQYWAGQIDHEQFAEFMQIVIRNGLMMAWHDGAMKAGIRPSELSPAERVAMHEAILEEIKHIGSALQYIDDHSKDKGFESALVLSPRLRLWMHRYNDIQSRALLMASEDQKLMWVMDMTRENCPSCAKLNGKVKRASYWKRVDVHPQDPPNQNLVCSGFGYCQLVPTIEACSRGRLPSLP